VTAISENGVVILGILVKSKFYKRIELWSCSVNEVLLELVDTHPMELEKVRQELFIRRDSFEGVIDSLSDQIELTIDHHVTDLEVIAEYIMQCS
jgi:hypothetical protein